MEKKNKVSILLGVIILLLIIFGLPYIVPKRNKYTYLCLSKSVSENEIIYANMLKECGTSKELENNILTKEKLDSYGIKLLDKYDDNQTTYYIKENKKANEQISIEDIYWKLEEFTDKEIRNQAGDKYRIYISNDDLYINNVKSNESVKIFDYVPVKTFAMQPNGGAGDYKIILTDIYNNVYISRQTKDEILSSQENKISDFSFNPMALRNINSLIVTNKSESLNEHIIYVIDDKGIKYNTEIFNIHYIIDFNKKEEQLSRNNYIINFQVIDGKLNITDKNNNLYTLDKISNIKNISLFSHNSADDIQLFILTNDGKLYFIKDIINKISNINEFKNAKIEEIKFKSKIDLIGTTTEYVSPPITTFLVVKSEDKSYLFYGPGYDNYIEIDAKWKE